MNYFKHDSAIIDEGASIGENCKIWHFSHIMKDAVLGQNCNVGQNVFIASQVIIGNNVKIQNNVSLYSGVTCEDDVFLGPSMVFTNILNPRSQITRRDQYINTTVKRGASIGANSTIICGITIGSYAMIGAGAVVTKDVKNFALMVGNPSKQIGWVSEYGQTLELDINGFAICPESGEKYQLEYGELYKIDNA